MLLVSKVGLPQEFELLSIYHLIGLKPKAHDVITTHVLYVIVMTLWVILGLRLWTRYKDRIKAPVGLHAVNNAGAMSCERKRRDSIPQTLLQTSIDAASSAYLATRFHAELINYIKMIKINEYGGSVE